MSNYVELTDNLTQGKTVRGEDTIADILKIANIGLLRNAPDLLVFPHSFKDTPDEIGSLSVLTTGALKFDAAGHLESVDVHTGNLIGFVGVNNTSISIFSRFCNKSDTSHCENDYFLYYMMQKVFALNVFSLQHSSNSRDKVLDFLMFLFPYLLKNALAQGIYKEYHTYRNNDANLRGTIDINRFVKFNTPFRGTVCYTHRTQSYDNPVTQLIRHTIEFIRHHSLGSSILSANPDVADGVKQIVCATPTFNIRNRRQVLNSNLKAVAHPYYSAYKPLQQLCIRILQHDTLKYGTEKNKIHGILFDAAWLWEEYLATLLSELDFKHPQNKLNKGAVFLFKSPKAAPRYPDFWSDGFVIDAKYKRYEHLSPANIDRDDLAQIISYMYILSATTGAFIVPCISDNLTYEAFINSNYGGNILLFKMLIPRQSTSFNDFADAMRLEENRLISEISTRSKFIAAPGRQT